MADERRWRPLAGALNLPNILSKSHQAAVTEFYAADAKAQPQKWHVSKDPPMVAVTQEPPPEHRGREPSFLHFSPDGSTLVSGHEGVVRLQNAATSATTAVLKIWVHSAVFSPDSRTLAVKAIRDVYLVDSATGTGRAKIEQKKNTGTLSALAFTPDSRTLAIGHGGKPEIYEGRDHSRGKLSLTDVGTGVVKRVIKHKGAVTALAFHSDGRTLASGSARGVMRFVDVVGRTWPVAEPVAEHKGKICAVILGQRRSRFAAVSPDGAVHLIAFNDKRRRVAAHTAAACQRGAGQATASQAHESQSWLDNLHCFRPGLQFVERCGALVLLGRRL